VSGTASSAASSVQDAASSRPEPSRTGGDGGGCRAGGTGRHPAPDPGNPLAAGLIAFGAGWLVSSLLPATRREQELADQAKQVAQEKVQPVAQQVAAEVRRTSASRPSRPSSR
jgi:hypothetical protein